MCDVGPEKDLSVSPVQYHRPFWRYLLLFQSWTQFESWVAMCTLAAGTFCAFLLVMNEPFRNIYFEFTSLAIGALVAVVLCLPAQFTVNATSANALRPIKNALKNMRYIEAKSSDNEIRYCQNLPSILRWSEGEVLIKYDAGKTTITGPQFILTIIRKKLVRQPWYLK